MAARVASEWMYYSKRTRTRLLTRSQIASRSILPHRLSHQDHPRPASPTHAGQRAKGRRARSPWPPHPSVREAMARLRTVLPAQPDDGARWRGCPELSASQHQRASAVTWSWLSFAGVAGNLPSQEVRKHCWTYREDQSHSSTRI